MTLSYLSSLICEMGMINTYNLKVIMKIKQANANKTTYHTENA